MKTKSLVPYNEYTFECTASGKPVRYKLCLHILEAVDRPGSAGATVEACRKADACGKCKARQMAREEIKAGAQLYYEESPLKAIDEAATKPRVVEPKFHEKTSESYRRGFACLDQRANQPRSVQRPQPAKRAKRAVPLAAPTESPYATLVKETAKREKAPNQLAPLPGESVRDFIKRIKQGAVTNAK